MKVLVIIALAAAGIALAASTVVFSLTVPIEETYDQ
jgi:hypothetical protein